MRVSRTTRREPYHPPRECASEERRGLASGDRGERVDEPHVRVERLDALEAEPAALSLLARRDVDVVEHLEVVGQELHWRHQDCTMSLLTEQRH